MSKYIVTGFAGFIGYHLTKRLLEEGHEMLGIDNFNSYYDQKLKRYRKDKLNKWFVDGALETYCGADLRDDYIWENIATEEGANGNGMDFDAIFHLAAIPGVRKSFESPEMYVQNNIMGSINVLKAAGEYGIKKVILASSSSVYGDSANFTDINITSCSESRITDKPLSPYAVTKRAMELVGYTYHMLYCYDVIIPRFFTVYGPAGRPDMAYYKFIKAALADETIDVYGDGEQVRDFTYIYDIVDGLIGLSEVTGYDLYNLGSGNPVSINTMIQIISDLTGKDISINKLDIQAGDVRATFADNSKAKQLLGWEPKWTLEDGIKETVKWFQETDLTEMEGEK